MNRYEGPARRLREDFDALYAQAPPPPPDLVEGLLAIRVAGDNYALRVAEVGRMAPCRVVTPLPGAPPAFSGLVGLRGEVLPLWDLAGLLDYPAPRPQPRWMICCRPGPAWAVAFDGYEGHLKAALPDFKPFVGGGRAAGLAESLVVTGDVARPVLSLEKLLQFIRTKEIR